MIVGARLSGSDWVEGGFNPDEAVIVARALKDAGIAFVCASGGGMSPSQKVAVVPGYQVPFAERIRREAGIATRAVGLITEPAMAEAIVAEATCRPGRARPGDPRRSALAMARGRHARREILPAAAISAVGADDGRVGGDGASRGPEERRVIGWAKQAAHAAGAKRAHASCDRVGTLRFAHPTPLREPARGGRRASPAEPNRTATTARPHGEADPDADARRGRSVKASTTPSGRPIAPIADRGKDHRHARVVQAAQHADADHLSRRRRSGTGRRSTRKVTASPMTGWLAGRRRSRKTPTSSRRQRSIAAPWRSIGDAEHAGGPAGARAAARVLRRRRRGRRGPSRPGDAQRHHEGDRRDLHGDGMRGERSGADQAHQERRGIEYRHLEGEADGRSAGRASRPGRSAASRPARSGRTGDSGESGGRSRP